MTNLEKLQNWYLAQTNGDWEHSYGIKIQTTDNPAWHIEIDLNETPFETVEKDYHLHQKSEQDWYAFQIKNKTFVGVGDISKLDFLLGIFFQLIENQSFTS